MATRAIPTLLFFLALSSTSPAQDPPALPLADQLRIAEDRNQAHSAAEIIRRMLVEKPDDLNLLTRLARHQLQSKDLDRCSATMKHMGTLGGHRRADVLELRGDLALALEHPSDALSSYELAHKAAPGSVRTLEKLAEYHEDAGNHSEATDYYKKLIKLRKNAKDHRRLARAALVDRDWNQVVKHLAIANEVDPSNQYLKFETLMSKAAQLGRYDHLIAKSPQSVDALLSRALLFDECNFDREALADAKRAERVDGSSPRVRYAVAFYYYSSGNHDACSTFNVGTRGLRIHKLSPKLMKSLADYDSRLKSTPDDPSVLRSRAKILMDFTQAPLAMEDIERLLKADPDSVANQLLKVRALRLTNEPRAAKQLVRYLAKQFPENEDVQQAVGNIQVEDGLYAEAIHTFDKILARHPKYEAAQTARALCYRRLRH